MFLAAITTTTLAVPITRRAPTPATIPRTVILPIRGPGGFDWTGFGAFLAAAFAAVAAFLLWRVAVHQLAALRAELGDEGAVRVRAARASFDPRVHHEELEVTRLRPLPNDEPQTVRVVGLHLRNVGPFEQRVSISERTTPTVGRRPRQAIEAKPAWGRHCAEPDHEPHDFLPASARSTTDLAVYLIGDWGTGTKTRLRIELVMGGGETVLFDDDVVLWKLVD